VVLVALAVLAAWPVSAADDLPTADDLPWIPLADGIDFLSFHLPGPNRAYVARMDIHNPSVSLEGMVAQGDLPGRRETVSRMARRYEDSLSAWGGTWGERRDVVVAINGTFFSPASGIPYGAEVHGGWFSFWPFDQTGPLTFGWTLDRRVLTSECLVAPRELQRAVFPSSGRELLLTGVDIALPANGLVVYTPEYTQLVAPVPGSVQVLVELNRPAMIGPPGQFTFGAIRAIYADPQELQLPFDTVALVGHGRAATHLLESATLGGTVGLGLTLEDRGPYCGSNPATVWSQVYSGLGGGVFFLRGGAYRPPTDGTASDRHPRTAVCSNDDRFYFVVVDGRRAGWSIGMTLAEMAEFCADTLEAEWGINLDGGGSSTMWVGGEVINQPSDGQERRVPDGLMMVRLEPAQRSFSFTPGDTVQVTSAVQFKRGPGWNYLAWGELPDGAQGRILHPLSGLEGVLASGSFWWEVDFGEVSGWVPEQALSLVTDADPLALPVLP
jgi:hypothetical protein